MIITRPPLGRTRIKIRTRARALYTGYIFIYFYDYNKNVLFLRSLYCFSARARSVVVGIYTLEWSRVNLYAQVRKKNHV